MIHTVVRGDSLYKIANQYGISFNELLAENPRFKADPDSLNIGDKIAIPIISAVAKEARKSNDEAPVTGAGVTEDGLPFDRLKVPRGQLTFDVEGSETPGPYFSRVLHVPGNSSGATIGRGYDMKYRSTDEVVADLVNAGVGAAKARQIAQCSGYVGNRAKKRIQELGLTELTITQAQQQKLFIQVYQEYEGEVLRICNKADVVAKYGETDWAQTHPALQDIVVDLIYRGDYKPKTREEVQPLLVSNDLPGMAALMADRSYWRDRFGVPRDRFNRRRDYLALALTDF